MYFNTKKVKIISSAKSYIFLYYFISIATIVALSIAPILIEPSVLNSEQLLPAFFILIAFIITFCLTTYSKVAITLEENAISKIQLEKAAMEAEYNTQIDDKLQQLHTLRHDMKNHLLVIDSLSAECKNEQIRSYIRKITDELNQTQTISSSSSAISALLNSKKLICDDYKITFSPRLDFSDIYISDFTLITILGNILDNAISAASKADNGYINLIIEQAGTYLAIHCENNHCEKIKKKEGRFISSKPSSGSKSNPLHGLGIISLTNTVEKNGGSVDINYNDSVFTIDILIPNYI
ncbi:MAG: GHKL domain-containing protein [Lachnospira sp.]